MYQERSGSAERVECAQCGGPDAPDEVCEAALKRLSGLGDGEFGWVHLVDPAGHVVARLAEPLGLHALAAEDAVQAH